MLKKTTETIINFVRGYVFAGFKARHIKDIPLRLNRPYLVKGLLLPKQVSVLAAPPNTGKSTIVAALLAKLSQGHAFAGRRVRKSAVLFVGAEDADGMAMRADGHFKSSDLKADTNFLVLDRAIDMSNTKTATKFTTDVRAFYKKTGATRLIVVFDTLTLSIGNSDENSAGDMTRVMANALNLAHETGAHVMFVHHTAAADPTKVRGSTALLGSPDTVLVLKPANADGENRVLMEMAKQRSLEKGDPVGFIIEAQEYGYDDEGDPVSNPFARWVANCSDWQVSSKQKSIGNPASKGRNDEVLRVLRGFEKSSNAYGETFSAVKISKHVSTGFDRGASKPESIQKAVRTTLNGLVKSGEVEKVGTKGYRISGAAEPLLDYATLH